MHLIISSNVFILHILLHDLIDINLFLITDAFRFHFIVIILRNIRGYSIYIPAFYSLGNESGVLLRVEELLCGSPEVGCR